MDLPKRKTIRLPEFDYSTPGAYFVTICTQNRRQILSSVRRGDPCGRPTLELSPYGECIERCIWQTEALYDVCLAPYVIMPNHIHFICTIDGGRATTRVAPTTEDGRETIRVAPTLGRIVGAMKSLSANQCRLLGLEGKLWQRGYHEHVIRNEKDYREIWTYIDVNPVKWTGDCYFSD